MAFAATGAYRTRVVKGRKNAREDGPDAMSLPHRSWRNDTADLTDTTLFVFVVAAAIFVMFP